MRSLIELEKLRNLRKYDEKIFLLTPEELVDISREWALISMENQDAIKDWALRQTMLYLLQAEISQGLRAITD